LHELIDELQHQYGPFAYDRIDQRVQPFKKADLVHALKAEAPQEIAGVALQSINDRDGVKYLLADQSWLLIRPSGTEPVLRIYAEAANAEQVQALLQAGVQFANQQLTNLVAVG